MGTFWKWDTADGATGACPDRVDEELEISEKEKGELLKDFQALRVERQPGKDDPLYAKHSPNNEELQAYRRGWNAALDSIMRVLQEKKWR